MKRLLLVLLTLTLTLSLFSSCNDTETETTNTPAISTECEHTWQRTNNLNESTAVDKCQKCGKTRLYTDPDSLPSGYHFSGKYTVTTSDRTATINNCSVQTILDILNRSHWEKEILAADYDYIFTVNGTEVEYSSELGMLANFNDLRHQKLSDSDRLLINGWIETLFTRDVHQVRFLLYNWEGYGISTKTVSTCELAYSMMDALEKAAETGEVIEAISNEVVDDTSTELPIEPGTMWLEVGAKIYRIDPDLTKLYRMESHLGKGSVLTMSEQLKTMIRDAWHYYPFDYYSGTYANETNELKLNHLYTAASTVRVSIKNIKVENSYDPNNKITIALQSTIDQTVQVSLDCHQSSDNLARGDWKNVTLKAGTSETVELTFGGWKDFPYWIDLSVDNTKIIVKIEP